MDVAKITDEKKEKSDLFFSDLLDNKTDALSKFKSPKIGEHLIEKGLISENALKFALEEQKVTGDRLGKILVKNGFVGYKKLIESIHELNMYQLSNEKTIFTKCPIEILVKYRIIILAETREEIFAATTSDEWLVRRLITPYYPGCKITFHSISLEFLDRYIDELRVLTEGEDALLERILREALKDGVSDVHILPRSDSYTITFRYLGVLQHAHEGDLEECRSLISQIKTRSNLDIAERRIPQDGAFQIEHNGRMIDMRVATIPTVNGEKVVIRLLDPESVKTSLDELGITEIEKWRKAFGNSHGICLICGPTGSGKTSTLNATVREMDRFGKSINSLEDPVEYQIPYITQVNINHLVGLDFAKGIRSFMRGDPDVIIIGELRDTETAQNAIKAAETGHMVMGTLHTGSINGAVDRLKDLDVNVSDLRHLLRGILVQRLIRVFCEQCGGEGCLACKSTGYSDRTIISEAEYFNGPEDVDRLLNGETWWDSLIDDAVLKMHEGLTSEEEILRIFTEQGKRAIEKSNAKRSDAEKT